MTKVIEKLKTEIFMERWALPKDLHTHTKLKIFVFLSRAFMSHKKLKD